MATAAVGLASLSNTIHTPKWSSMAQSLYGRAIRQVHAAVGDPVLQQSDQTLTAIMLLGFYEVRDCLKARGLLSHVIIVRERYSKYFHEIL